MVVWVVQYGVMYLAILERESGVPRRTEQSRQRHAARALDVVVEHAVGVLIAGK